MTTGDGSESVPIPGFVYLIGEIDGCHKIGMSIDPETRVKALSRPGSPLRIVHTIATTDQRWLERVLHAAYDHARVGGEWFRLGTDDIYTLVSLAVANDVDDLPEPFRLYSDAHYMRCLPASFAPPLPAGHMIRIPDDHWKMVQERAIAEGRTVPQVLKIAVDVYFQAFPKPTIPWQLPTGAKPNA